MYFLQYLRYFTYIAWHWNTRLAWFMLRNEIAGEKKFGIRTTGIDTLSRSLSKAQRIHASIYQPVNFYTAETLFSHLQASDKKGILLDAGCGKGRVMAMAAYYGFRQIEAFDLSPDMHAHAQQLANDLRSRYPAISIRVVCADAAAYEVDDAVSVIFLFNPFDDFIMHFFVQQVMKSLRRHPRHLKVLYANPLHKQLWLNEGFSESFHFRKLTWLEGSVLEYKP